MSREIEPHGQSFQSRRPYWERQAGLFWFVVLVASLGYWGFHLQQTRTAAQYSTLILPLQTSTILSSRSTDSRWPLALQLNPQRPLHELQLRLAVGERSPGWVNVELVSDGGCRWLGREHRTDYKDNDLVRLQRTEDPCLEHAGSAILTIQSEFSTKLGWKLASDGDLHRAPVAHQGQPLSGVYLWEEEQRSTSRLDLMDWVWQEASPWVGWIWGTSGGMVLLGSYWIFACGRWSAPAQGLLFLGVAWAFAVTIPPLQSPDEPAHLNAVAQLIDKPHWDQEYNALAHRIQYFRIAFHPDQRIGPFDQDRAREARTTGGWEGRGEIQAFERSLWAGLVWSIFGAFLGQFQPTEGLLLLRLLHACGFSLLIVLGLWLLQRAQEAHHTLPILWLVPALPFWAFFVSDYALLLWVAFAQGLVILLWLNPAWKSEWGRGLGVGLLGILWLLGPVSGVFQLLMVPLLGWTRQHRQQPLVFWSLAFLPLVALTALASELPKMEKFYQRLGRLGPMLQLTPTELVAWLPLLLSLSLLIFGLLCIALESAWASRKITGLVAKDAKGPNPWLYVGGVIIVSLAGGWWSLPEIPNTLLVHPLPSYQDFAVLVGAHLLRLLSFGSADNLLSLTFWSGFGWGDVFFPRRGIRGLAGLFGLLGCWVGWFLWNRRGFDTWTRWLWLTAGILCTGWLTAIGGLAMGQPVQGRYLLGMFVPLLMVVGWGGSLLWEESQCWRPWLGQIFRGFALFLLCWIPQYTLLILLNRYYI